MKFKVMKRVKFDELEGVDDNLVSIDDSFIEYQDELRICDDVCEGYFDTLIRIMKFIRRLIHDLNQIK